MTFTASRTRFGSSWIAGEKVGCGKPSTQSSPSCPSLPLPRMSSWQQLTFANARKDLGGDFKRCLTEDMGSAMVWSDPHRYNGWRDSPRGPGIYKYGRDVTLEFLKSKNLKRLLRHSLDLGEHHSVQTIFSSADYVGTFCVNYRSRPLRLPGSREVATEILGVSC